MEGGSPRATFVATVACPGENGTFPQPEAVAPIGQGTQGWPSELPRRMTVACPHLSFCQVLCWGLVPSALTVPAQGSAGLILQRGRAKPGAGGGGLNNVLAAGNSCQLCLPAPREASPTARLPVHGRGGRAATGSPGRTARDAPHLRSSSKAAQRDCGFWHDMLPAAG